MSSQNTRRLFEEFVEIVGRLRRECPWDREQTPRSLRTGLLEETYELVHAIDSEDPSSLKEELGDLLLHIGLQAVIGEETHAFTLDDVLASVNEKLVRRHPHVFGTAHAPDARHVAAHWEKSKLLEGRTSVLDGVPSTMPALLRAHRIQERVAKVGFDWKDKAEVWKKVREEIDELQQAVAEEDRPHIEEEFGDVLFALVNFGRFVGVNPEVAMNRVLEKFSDRFQYIERELAKRGKNPREATLEEMDALWNERKRSPPA